MLIKSPKPLHIPGDTLVATSASTAETKVVCGLDIEGRSKTIDADGLSLTNTHATGTLYVSFNNVHFLPIAPGDSASFNFSINYFFLYGSVASVTWTGIAGDR